MAKKQFKSESKRLLDLMINSIYTNREIFLREIISNASDAIDKLCYISVTDEKVGLNRDDFRIRIETDKDARTITVSDNGVGMTAEELESNLGVIARSGSLKFKADMADDKGDTDIIGQFGVGFYSAFMVAKKVTVISRAYGQEKANKWVSSGSDGYTVTECEKDSVGTDIIMELKDDTEEDKFSEYLEEYELHSLIKKYSDYIRWPIIMSVTKSRQVETDEVGADGKKKKDWEDYTEDETVNSRVPIWQRPKSEVNDEECFNFYKEHFYDTEEPVSVIRIDSEGTVSFKAMLFVPAKAPYDFYTRDYRPGLQLYSSGVMIMERCDQLLPDHFRFVRGIVDSPDLSLNISRELLQHDRQLKVIAKAIEKKIAAELNRLCEKEPDKYEKFYTSFGTQLKYSLLNSYGTNRETLQELLMFYSGDAEKLIPLKRYAENMPESQKSIYYACGETRDLVKKLPQAETVREHGYDILYLTEDADEFVVKMLEKYNDKPFVSISSGDLGLESDDEKAETEKKETEAKELLDFVKEALDGKVAAVKLSHKLKTKPVCLSTQGDVTLEMERYFANLKRDNGPSTEIKAERVLELNASHPMFAALQSCFAGDKDKAKKYAELLYGQALLMAGVPLDDASAFSDLICDLMV